MKRLFEAVQGDPLETCVKLAAYYGLRRSGVLGLKWSEVNFKNKTISIRHKVIEDLVDGHYVPIGKLFRKSYCLVYLDYICLDKMGKYDLKKISYHNLRHICASLLLANESP